MSENSTEVVVTVTSEIDAALDAWGRAIINAGVGAEYAIKRRLAANKAIQDAIGARVAKEVAWRDETIGRLTHRSSPLISAIRGLTVDAPADHEIEALRIAAEAFFGGDFRKPGAP